MSQTIDFSLRVATVNGSGSQSSNNILLKSLFRMGLDVSGKNLFPSNIAGLPTWYCIRVNNQGYHSMAERPDISICLNKQTWLEDVARVPENGLLIHSTQLKLPEGELAQGAQVHDFDFLKLAGEVSSSIKLKKLLANMVYVGVLAEALKISEELINEVIADQFSSKPAVIEINQQAVAAGRRAAQETSLSLPKFALSAAPQNTQKKTLMEGNVAGALGNVFGGCTFMSWYPITPSSSLAENFEAYCKKWRVNEKGENLYAVVQAEDELSAISMVTGASWAGARAMTTTSGPGTSLMAECAGLMYFAEIPGVIWNVQRAGPSTGLPTRTMQGDIASCAYLSHGDAKHPLLFPASPKECFEMAQTALDLSEQAQTLVFVMSDLDLGMNHWVGEELEYPKTPIQRGKVLSKDDLDQQGEFHRYKDVDGDGIPQRTLPGTASDLAGYFTRGTGHDESANYTESAEVFKNLLDRLNKKWNTIKTMVPSAEVELSNSKKVGLIAYGSSHQAMNELRDQLQSEGIETSYLRIKAFPFGEEIQSFLDDHETCLVLEQNRDAQMKRLLIDEFPQYSGKLQSILTYDGLPVRASLWSQEVKNVVQ